MRYFESSAPIFGLLDETFFFSKVIPPLSLIFLPALMPTDPRRS